MKILNLGSLCIDNVYCVPHFVKPGETLPCTSYDVHPGGKGLNQSLALAYSGMEVWHAGKAGLDGSWLVDLLQEAGVNTSLIQLTDLPNGHANIQVTPEGENAIVLFAGANKSIDSQYIDKVFDNLDTDDILLLQNEISGMPEILERAARQSIRVVFNTAPITEQLLSYPLDGISLLILNEVEGEALTGQSNAELILHSLSSRYPDTGVILTLGEEGAGYCRHGEIIKQSAFPVSAIDATGAGDTFTGYFLSAWCRGESIGRSLESACMAGALCVQKEGAASSIPKTEDLERVFGWRPTGG